MGRWTFESLRDFPSRLHSNPTDPNLAELCYCSMSKTFAWNVGHVNLDSPRSSPVWPSRPPPLQTHWSGGPDAEPRTRSIEKGRDPKGKLSAAFLPVSLCRLTVHSDEPSRDGKQALGNRSVDLFALRRKQEYELTYSFSGFVLGHMSPGEKKKKKRNPATITYFQRTLGATYAAAAAAVAKSLQSCPTLGDPIEGSPPGSPVPGILQARTLEWVAISFSKEQHIRISNSPFCSQPMHPSHLSSDSQGSNPCYTGINENITRCTQNKIPFRPCSVFQSSLPQPAKN